MSNIKAVQKQSEHQVRDSRRPERGTESRRANYEGGVMPERRAEGLRSDMGLPPASYLRSAVTAGPAFRVCVHVV